MKAQSPIGTKIRVIDEVEGGASDGEREVDKDPEALEMFLPMLCEHPTKTAAWRVGSLFRNMAMSLVMQHFKFADPVVREYRKSGAEIKARDIKPMSRDDMKEEILVWAKYIQDGSQVTKDIDVKNRWRFLIMQIVLGDVSLDNEARKRMPQIVKEVLVVLNGGELDKWDLVHWSARYQAAFYSLRMVKEVVAWVVEEGWISAGRR